ncbi:transposase, partial [Aphanizomenon flos-aquae]
NEFMIMVNQNILILRPKFNIFLAIFIRLFLTFNTSGSKTNQKFVQVPTARLKNRIAQLCDQHGIKFVETEESYTSKTSFLDNDFLPTFGAKPEGWKSSGTRVNRGLFRSQDGTKINADCNGAANIFRKVAVKLGLNSSGISRGALISPLRLFIWS